MKVREMQQNLSFHIFSVLLFRESIMCVPFSTLMSCFCCVLTDPATMKADGPEKEQEKEGVEKAELEDTKESEKQQNGDKKAADAKEKEDKDQEVVFIQDVGFTVKVREAGRNHRCLCSCRHRSTFLSSHCKVQVKHRGISKY